MIEITDWEMPELKWFQNRNETQLLHYFEPEPGIFIAESPNVILRALEAGYEPLCILTESKTPGKMEKQVMERCSGIPVYAATQEMLTQLTGFHLTRGILCAMRRKALPSPSDLCSGASRIAILENVVNPTNVGAIFRSAVALGIDAILLTYGCSDPLYRRAVRVSMGTVFQVPWTILEKGKWPDQELGILREMGYKTAAMALLKDSLSLEDERLQREEKLAIVLGTEGDGLSPHTMACCDYTVYIPMNHGVDSLNVAAASAVAFWELGKRQQADERKE